MTENNYPSVDPALNGHLQGLLIHAFNKLMQNTDGMLPAVVVSYDDDKKIATVQPQVLVVRTDGTLHPRAQVTGIPVLQFGGGGYVLKFPLKAGDFGWIFGGDRDLTDFKENLTNGKPLINRVKEFANGMFIPDKFRNYTVNAEDKDHCVLQNQEGTIRVALWPDKIKMTAPEVVVDGNLLVTGGITGQKGINVSNSPGAAPLTVNGDTEFKGNVRIENDLRTEGNITAKGNITANVPD